MLSLGVGDYVAGTVVQDKHSEEIRPDWNTSPRKLSTPQLSQLTPKKLVLIETYPHPGWTRPNRSDNTAFQITTRIRAKTGIQRPPDQSCQFFTMLRPTYSKVSLKTKVLLASFGNVGFVW